MRDASIERDASLSPRPVRLWRIFARSVAIANSRARLTFGLFAPLEILDRALVLLGLSPCLECAEIAALSGFRIYLS